MRETFTGSQVAVAVADLDIVGETRPGAGVASKRDRSDAQAGGDMLDYYARSGVQGRAAPTTCWAAVLGWPDRARRLSSKTSSQSGSSSRS